MVIITAGTWWYFHVQSISIFLCSEYLLSTGSSLQAQAVWKHYIHNSEIKRPVKLTGRFPLPDHHLTIRKHQWVVHFSWRLSSHCKLSLLEKNPAIPQLNSYAGSFSSWIPNTLSSRILFIRSMAKVEGERQSCPHCYSITTEIPQIFFFKLLNF